MILVCGATGYVGRALLPVLATASAEPVRALVRREFDAVRLREDGYDAVTADLLAGRGIDRATRGVRTLVYLVHTLDAPGDVIANDLHAIQNTLLAARAAGVERVVYLSHIAASDEARSAHLLARWGVELAVHQSGLRWTVLRAPLIVGPPAADPGSTPFEMVRRLVAHSPVVPLFRWRAAQTEPVALADVVEALTLATTDEQYEGRSFDICGAERLPMRDVVRGWAHARRRPRVFVPLPLGGEALLAAASWATTGLPRQRTRALLETLGARQVCADPSRRFPLPHRPQGYRQAVVELPR